MHLIDPFPGCYDAADPFGSSAPPRTRPHTGSDWIVGPGRGAPAIGGGVVVGTHWHPGNGNTVSVRLDDSELYYAYLHLQEPAGVVVGQHVERGQILGRVGDTGTNSRGAHLHVTVSDAATVYCGLGELRDPWAFIQNNHELTQKNEEALAGRAADA